MKPPIFLGLSPDQVTDQHPGLIVMVFGPSHVGKTYTCEHIIAPRLGAAFLSTDLLYSEAVMCAGMTARTGDHYSVDLIRARSRARDRKWEVGREKAFFDAYAASPYEKRREAAQPPPVKCISDLRVTAPQELDRILSAR
ncbi:hypothetical protein BH10PSE6_BH10PSE6_43550 [soil metagenome]